MDNNKVNSPLYIHNTPSTVGVFRDTIIHQRGYTTVTTLDFRVKMGTTWNVVVNNETTGSTIVDLWSWSVDELGG